MSDMIYPFGNEQIADLIELLAYVEDDERRHYNSLPKSERRSHIYPRIRALQKWVDEQRTL